MSEGTKTCCDCHQEKPLDGFNRQRRNKDGHRSMCRPCDNARTRAYHTWYEREHGETYGDAWLRGYQETRGVSYWSEEHHRNRQRRYYAEKRTAEPSATE